MPLDGQWNIDGSRMQGWLNRNLTTRRTERPMGLSATQVGLVIKRHDKDQPSNTQGSYAEYDVMLIENYQILYNLSVKGLRLNDDTGDIAILKPASSMPELNDPTTADINIMASDGDLVCVEFVAQKYPIISGCMNHIKSGSDTAPYHPISTDGEVRKIYHKGSELTIEEDGDIYINVPDNKGLTVDINGSQIFRIYKDGTGMHIELGSSSASESLILGDAFKTWFDARYPGHTHPGVTAGTASTGPPAATPGLPDMQVPSTSLSDISKTEK